MWNCSFYRDFLVEGDSRGGAPLVLDDDDDVVGPCAQGQALGFVGHELRDLAQSLFVAPLIAAFDRERKKLAVEPLDCSRFMTSSPFRSLTRRD